MKKLLVPIVILALLLSGCNLLEQSFSDIKSAFKGREAVIQTYDEESNIIDRVTGKSIDISPENKFAISDSEGKTVEKSAVINLTVGGKSMLHVGSSLIMREQGLVDVFDEYAKTVDITSHDRSVPFVNRMVNEMKNLTTGQRFLIMIRSQTGKPLATFVGNDVSYFSTKIDKSTMFRIDNKALFVYRCDYTIIDLSLLR
jgi:predicted small secreted protein